MKSTSTMNGATMGAEISKTFVSGGDAILGALRATGAAFGRVFEAMQKARLCSILSSLDDAQLAEIGIKRAEITAYATKLVKGEFDA
ncbi:MAG: DUF1127 domain-containing protein [Sulfitobacter sp.]